MRVNFLVDCWVRRLDVSYSMGVEKGLEWIHQGMGNARFFAELERARLPESSPLGTQSPASDAHQPAQE